MDIISTLKQHREYYWDEIYRINLAKDVINVAYYKKDNISSDSHDDTLEYLDRAKIDRISKVDYIDNLLLHISDSMYEVIKSQEHILKMIDNEDVRLEIKSILA